MKPRIKSVIWHIGKQKTTNQNKKRESEKNKDRVSSLWDNFKCSNIHIIGVREGEEKEQEIGNLFEKIMKENFPNLTKEIDRQVQEAQRVPNKMEQRGSPPNIIKCQRLKIKREEGGMGEWVRGEGIKK